MNSSHRKTFGKVTLRVAVTCSFLLLALTASPAVSIQGVNYTNHIQMTNQDWYYMDQNGNPLPLGGGVFPDRERLSPTSATPLDVPAVAYVRNANMKIEFTIWNNGFLPGNGTVTLYRYHWVSGIPVTEVFTAYWSAGANATTVCEVDLGSAPSQVGRMDYTWFVSVDDTINGGSDGGPWLLPVYTTYSAPTGIQTHPWMEVLDLACDWAAGADTAQEVVDSSTFGMFFSQRYMYDFERLSRYVEGLPGTGTIAGYATEIRFKLKNFVNEPWTTIDCKDGSAFLHIACAALGVTTELNGIWTGTTGQLPSGQTVAVGWHTNKFCRIGNDPTLSGNYQPTVFGHHQINFYNMGIYDVVAAQEHDPSGGNYYNPPMGWVLPGYWQSTVGANHYGLANRYALLGHDVWEDVPLDGDVVTIMVIE